MLGLIGSAGGAGAGPTFPDGTVMFVSSVLGAFSFLIPAQAPGFVWIEGWAGGGCGSITFAKDSGTEPSYGGAAGGYFKHHVAVTPGTTIITGTVGAGSVPSVSIAVGTFIPAYSLVANPGGDAQGGVAAGLGGTASGGSISNSTGHNGGRTNIWDGGGSAPGYVDITTAGAVPGVAGDGGPGGLGTLPSGQTGIQSGANGSVVITAKVA